MARFGHNDVFDGTMDDCPQYMEHLEHFVVANCIANTR